MQDVFDPDKAPKRQGKNAFVVKNILPYLNSALILVILIITVILLSCDEKNNENNDHYTGKYHIGRNIAFITGLYGRSL